MATRGLIAFLIDGTQKVSYRRNDSDPSVGGMEVLHFCREVTDWEAVRQSARALVVVAPGGIPSYLTQTQGHPRLILASGLADPLGMLRRQ
jgi:hypothetical protein